MQTGAMGKSKYIHNGPSIIYVELLPQHSLPDWLTGQEKCQFISNASKMASWELYLWAQPLVPQLWEKLIRAHKYWMSRPG